VVLGHVKNDFKKKYIKGKKANRMTGTIILNDWME